jgi:hypothetical protein
VPRISQVTAQDTIERALAAAKPGSDLGDRRDEHSTVNLRWAGNTPPWSR